MYDKETVYDAQISPLMAKIISICKENNIQMLSSFYLREDADGQDDNLICTTYIPSDESNLDALMDAKRVITNGYVAQKPFVMAATIVKGDAR